MEVKNIEEYKEIIEEFRNSQNICSDCGKDCTNENMSSKTKDGQIQKWCLKCFPHYDDLGKIIIPTG